ncbi:hypothetical protein K493DRAFT_240019, partial [Basidiobolus meristosporus CBS 931.73]
LKQFVLPVPENEIWVLLMNLKCGAFGLNLQMVSVMIFTDNWWNLFVEAHAKACVQRVN